MMMKKLKLPHIKFARTPVVLAGAFVIISIVLSLVAPRPSIATDPSSGSYRWRNDDGTEAAATFAHPENTTPNRFPPDSPMRLRFSLDNYAADSGPLEKAVTALNTGETITSSVIDADAGYAYITTNQAYDYDGLSPSSLVKVALGAGDVPPVRIGTVPFAVGDGYITTAMIDTTHGYAYFSTNSSKLIKFSLGDGGALPVRIGAIDCSEDGYLGSAVIDPAHGYAYFHSAGDGNYVGAPPNKVVKFSLGDGDALPVRIGALTLNEGENFFFSASVIDPSAGYAYFCVGTFPPPDHRAPATVVKVALGAGDFLPTRVAALTLDSGDFNPQSAVIDPSAGYAYFGTYGSADGDHVIKVALGTDDAAPTRVGAATLNEGEMFLTQAVIDTANGYAYFGTMWADPVVVVKIALGSGDTPPSEVGPLSLNSGESHFLQSMLIDPAHGHAYVGVGQSVDHFVKISLGAGDALPVRDAALDMAVGEDNISVAVIDAANGYAYFGTCTTPAEVVKVNLEGGDAAPVSVGSTILNPGEDCTKSAVIDADAGYAYFGTANSVVKVALGAGDAPPVRIGAVTLENDPASAVIDPAAGYAYFGTANSVVKVALGAGDDPPAVAGSVVFDGDENNFSSAVIDPDAGYAYFGTRWNSIVVKVALGAGSDPPTRVGAVILNADENDLITGVIDTANGYAYFGTFSGNGYYEKVIKVALGAGSDPPTRVGAAKVNDAYLESAVIDTANGCAYFSSGASIIKIALGAGDASPFEVITVPNQLGEVQGGFQSAVIDPINQYIYYGTAEFPAKIVKVSYANTGDAFRLEYAEKGATCSDAHLWTQVPPTATNEVFQMYDSSNVTDGDPTTNVPGGLTDPPGEAFVPGEIKDASSETSPIVLNQNQFTEVEYSLESTTNAKVDATYCLRLTNAGAVFSASGSLFVETVVMEHAPSSNTGVSAPVITPFSGNANVPENKNANANENANLPTGGAGTNTPANSPVEPGTTFATYHFIGPENATSFNLYLAPSTSSMRLLVSNPDPLALSITETGLTPNTTYADRVVTAVADGTESAPSAAFPAFATLLNNFDSIAASYDQTAKTVTLTGIGALPNLTAGDSGVDFAIKDASGAVLFDSGFVQTPSLGPLASALLELGETYTVTVTPRNQDGVLSPSKDFSVTVSSAAPGQANVSLTKTADKTDVSSSSGVAVTKEIKYTITAANTGAAAAASFVMTDPIPAGLDFMDDSIRVASDLDDPDDVVSASYDSAKRTVKATLNELEPNKSFTVTFIVTPSPNAASGTVKNKASASWDQ